MEAAWISLTLTLAHLGRDTLTMHVVAAMTAGASGTLVTNPLWVIKTRFMARLLANKVRWSDGPLGSSCVTGVLKSLSQHWRCCEEDLSIRGNRSIL